MIHVGVVVVATRIWVLVDAKTIGVKKGQIQGMGNMGPWGWFFACLGFWIVSFPFYVAKRTEYKRINGKSNIDNGDWRAFPVRGQEPSPEGSLRR